MAVPTGWQQPFEPAGPALGVVSAGHGARLGAFILYAIILCIVVTAIVVLSTLPIVSTILAVFYLGIPWRSVGHPACPIGHPWLECRHPPGPSCLGRCRRRSVRTSCAHLPDGPFRAGPLNE